jgi:hypothetical protein
MVDWMKEPPRPEEIKGASWMDNPPSENELRGYDDLGPERTGALESGVRGAAQGVSLGFADEITGAGEALLDKIKGEDAPLSDLYAKRRDESRANYHKAEEDNPLAYGAGQVGGGAATMFVPGLGAAKGVKGLATLGGLAGLGSSEADSAAGMVMDTAKGAGLGAATGMIPGLGRAGKNMIDEVATAPLNAPASGVVPKIMQGVQNVGAKGNEILDTLTGGPFGKALRYGVAAKAQAPLDAAQYGPKAAQYIAQKASGGIDNYLKKSPAFSKMSDGAFRALSTNMASRFSSKQPVSEEQAKQEFVEGN